MKAFGTGWTARVFWKGIEVWNNELGRPLIAFHGKTEEFAGEMGVETCQVSLSHNRSQAVAVAILLGRTD